MVRTWWCIHCSASVFEISSVVEYSSFPSSETLLWSSICKRDLSVRDLKKTITKTRTNDDPNNDDHHRKSEAFLYWLTNM